MKSSFKQMSIRKSYKSMIFWGLILSYTIVFLLPNVFSIITYEKYNGVLKEKVVNSIDNALLQVQDIVDDQFREMDEIPSKMHRNKRLYSILAAQDLNRFEPYDFYEGVNELYNYKIINNFVDNILFYKPKNDLIITTSLTTDFNTFYGNILSYGNIPLAEVKKRFIEEKGISVWPAEKMVECNSNLSSDKITYIQNMAINDMDVRLLITINNDNFKNLFKKVLGAYKGNIYILDKNDCIITSLENSNVEIDYDFLKTISKDNNKISTKFNSKEMFVTTVKSERMQWKYVAIIPSGQVFEEVNSIRNTNIILAILLILGCIILSFYFSSRNYAPVHNITEMLFPEKTQNPNVKYTNEWEYIQKEVNSAIKGKKNIEQYLNQQKPELRSNYILLLMRGSSTDNEAVRLKLKPLDIKLDEGPFAVMIISIDGYRDSNGIEKNILDEDLLLYKSAVRNVAEELCMEPGVGYTTETNDNEVAVLICFNSHDLETNISKMEKNANIVLDTFEKYFNLNLTVGIGKIYNESTDIKNSFREARVALEYKIIKGNKTVIKYEDIKVVPGLVNYYSMLNEKEILDCLKRGDFDGIDIILKEIMRNLRENLPPLETARCIYFEILNTALRAFDLVGIENFNSLSINNRFQGLFSSETIEQLYSETLLFYKDICDYINNRKESKNFKLANEIMEYINNNYCDCNFSLVMLADEFDISTGYLSRFFKDQFGYTISEYIQKKRVETAKELLRTTGKNVVNIAEELGFGNVHTFIKTFKKHEGITPGEYRAKIT